MEIDIIGLISACSYALDCIEAELVNIKNKHGKRVAYISVRMGQFFDLPEDVLQDLAICALLHDNALTQYISEELQKHSAKDLTADLVANTTNLHCIYGEQNLAKIPFKTDVTNTILYHHEHADGTGPFTKNGMKFLCLRALSTLPMWWISSGTVVHLKHRDGIW